MSLAAGASSSHFGGSLSTVEILATLYDNVLNSSGTLIIGVDHYAENVDSLNWGREFNLNIKTTSREWHRRSKKKRGVFGNIISMIDGNRITEKK